MEAKGAIKAWAPEERPRERLAAHGPGNLSDSELLAVLFGTGSAGKDVLTWSRDVLQASGGLAGLMTMEPHHLLDIPGIGLARSMQIQAILELTRRYLAATLRKGEGFTRPEMVRDYLAAQLRHQGREVFVVLLLDSQHRLLHYCELFYGTINAAPVYPREIIKLVMRYNAAAVILAHNHPSGVAEPSDADQRVTDRIGAALQTIDVNLLDHFVIGAGETVSFKERGWL
ncbi:RadC family protein [Aliidiomarina indica]|uniref:RadC family protein n=1 Tax=Aliidiomarina indica TaxID=2749147 RepID=UPI00188F4FBB|nr:DNA repair protein RadC [Aliidiomarina indica]